MNLQEAPLYIGMLTCIAPLVAVLLRPGARLLRIATLIVAFATGVFLYTLLRVIQFGPTDQPNVWVRLLMASGVPLLLGGYLLTLSLGRDRPDEAFRQARRPFVLLLGAGIVTLFLLSKHSFLAGFDWKDLRGTIHLGALGKAYVSYLLVGIVLTGYNLENTYRLVPSHMRHHLRLPFLGFFGVLGFFTFILTTGLLYSSVGLGKLIAATIPLAFANILVGYSILRGALTDVAAPVSRSVVYSSFTAIAAGLYVLAVGVVAQVATFTHWSPDEVVTLSFGFLVVLLAVLLLFSNRFQRRMRRFIDRNFYVNRYDYRTQWSNVTKALESVIETESVLERARAILEDVFLADHITIALREEATLVIRPRRGKGTGDGRAILPDDSPLATMLSTERRSILLDRRPDDFEYIGIYAENQAWLDTTASQIIAPLLEGNHLLGCVGLERNHKDDPFTYEDVTLLDSVAFHIASKLREARHAEELVESREMSLISQWSNMLLHDLKNYLSPLRLVAHNLVEYQTTQGIAELASGDITRVADRMETLVRTLSELRDNPQRVQQRVDMNVLVRATLKEMHVERRDSLKVDLSLAESATVLGDHAMLQRVLENLVNNAIEAMNGSGTLSIETRRAPSRNNGTQVLVAVHDTGRGIEPEFLRDQLFRPFATTKKGGLGLGLYQSRSIVRAHGGELKVESQVGAGTTFQIIMESAEKGGSDGARELLPRTPDGVVT